jgi:hypothetical protein
MQRTLRARVLGMVGIVALAIGSTVVFSGVATADSPSDERATFHDGNVTTCEGAGFGDSTQVGADGNGSAADENVSGAVATNAGAIQPGQGEELNVTILGTNVVVDAVVVKGGNGYNVYEDESVLPPAAQPPQHYISPLNNGGNVPAISHWFVCYHTEEGPTTGNLAVHKTVVPPVEGVIVPTSFNVHVDCDSGDFDFTIVDQETHTITGLPIGDVCVVSEDDSAFPPLSAVSYTPPEAHTDGVEIGDGTTVTVGITNDFGDVLPETVVQPPVTPAAAVAAAPAFTG